MKKAPDAFRTISEAAQDIGLPAHVLRHWEDTFAAIRPLRRAGGRRYYRQNDIDLLFGVKVLLHDRGFTTKGVSKIFSDQGATHVAKIGAAARSGETPPASGGPAPVNGRLSKALFKLNEARNDVRLLRQALSGGG